MKKLKLSLALVGSFCITTALAIPPANTTVSISNCANQKVYVSTPDESMSDPFTTVKPGDINKKITIAIDTDVDICWNSRLPDAPPTIGCISTPSAVCTYLNTKKQVISKIIVRGNVDKEATPTVICLYSGKPESK
jgi:hypothetical protein